MKKLFSRINIISPFANLLLRHWFRRNHPAKRRYVFWVIDSYIYFRRQCSLSRFPSHRPEAGSLFCSRHKNTRGKVPRVGSRWKEFQLLPEAHRNSLYLEKRELNLRIKNTTSKFRETEVNRTNNAKANEVFRYPTELSIKIIEMSPIVSEKLCIFYRTCFVVKKCKINTSIHKDKR